MEKMIEQALSHLRYYITFRYDHGYVIGKGSVNLTDVDKMSIDFFKNNIQRSYKNNIDYYFEIVQEYPTTRSSKPYEVRLLDKRLFDSDVDYEQIKDKTIGECVLNLINNLKMDGYNEFNIEVINSLKSYLDENFNQYNMGMRTKSNKQSRNKWIW